MGFGNVAQVLRALGVLDQVVEAVDPLGSDIGRLRAGSLAEECSLSTARAGERIGAWPAPVPGTGLQQSHRNPDYSCGDLFPALRGAHLPRTRRQPGYQPRHRAQPKRRRGRIAIAAALVLVLGAVVVVGSYVANLAGTFNSRSNTIASAFPSERPDKDVDDGSRNILLLGSDSRGDGLDTEENKGEAGERSDTMMLVHLPEDRRNVYVMSIVRDLWVEVPGHGERKINAALSLGGYPLMIETMEQLLDTKIDNIVSIDFEGFGALTEALDGVTVDNPVPFCAGQVNPSCFEAGEITLEGTAALRYVRERKSFADGDFHRVQNQQRFVKGVLERFLNAETLGNPARIQDVVSEFSGFLSVDDTLDAATVAGLAFQLRDVRASDVTMFTIPTGPPATGPGGADIITRDDAVLEELRTALRSDTLADFLASGHGTDAFGGSITDTTGTGGTSSAPTGTPDTGSGG
ncbi:LCP family protein [Zafaria sp. J156]|uniref:LCP family protein n=1 Tax=Zafaria sp. J156 TaxID=3116490 RepID=UPI002E9DB370|nr:LCP family protein [Zafaria sp. J156]